MATAESGGDQLHLTAGYRNLREYGCSNQTSVTREPLCETTSGNYYGTTKK